MVVYGCMGSLFVDIFEVDCIFLRDIFFFLCVEKQCVFFVGELYCVELEYDVQGKGKFNGQKFVVFEICVFLLLFLYLLIIFVVFLQFLGCEEEFGQIDFEIVKIVGI